MRKFTRTCTLWLEKQAVQNLKRICSYGAQRTCRTPALYLYSIKYQRLQTNIQCSPYSAPVPENLKVNRRRKSYVSKHAKPNDLLIGVQQYGDSLFIYLPTFLAPNFRRKRRRLRSNPCRGSGFRLPLKSVLVSSPPGGTQEASQFRKRDNNFLFYLLELKLLHT